MIDIGDFSLGGRALAAGVGEAGGAWQRTLGQLAGERHQTARMMEQLAAQERSQAQADAAQQRRQAQADAAAMERLMAQLAAQERQQAMAMRQVAAEQQAAEMQRLADLARKGKAAKVVLAGQIPKEQLEVLGAEDAIALMEGLAGRKALVEAQIKARDYIEANREADARQAAFAWRYGVPSRFQNPMQAYIAAGGKDPRFVEQLRDLIERPPPIGTVVEIEGVPYVWNTDRSIIPARTPREEQRTTASQLLAERDALRAAGRMADAEALQKIIDRMGTPTGFAFGLPPSTEQAAPAPATASPPAASRASGGQLPQPRTQAEFDRLRVGELYLDEEGNVWRK